MVFADIQPESIAIFIPIIAVIGGISIAAVAIISGAKIKAMQMEERRIALEKGVALPEPRDKMKPVYSSRRAGGLVMTAIGLALTIALGTAEGAYVGVWGLIPLFIGIGLIIASVLDKREYDVWKQEDREDRLNQSNAPQPLPKAPNPDDYA